MKLRYAAGRQAFGEARVNWPKGAIVAYLVSDEYRVSDAHRGTGELTGILAGPVELTGRTIEAGYAKADKAHFPKVRAERKAKAVVIAARGGVLLAYNDEVSNFPVQPNGGDIDVTFDAYLFRV